MREFTNPTTGLHTYYVPVNPEENYTSAFFSGCVLLDGINPPASSNKKKRAENKFDSSHDCNLTFAMDLDRKEQKYTAEFQMPRLKFKPDFFNVLVAKAAQSDVDLKEWSCALLLGSRRRLLNANSFPVRLSAVPQVYDWAEGNSTSTSQTFFRKLSKVKIYEDCVLLESSMGSSSPSFTRIKPTEKLFCLAENTQCCGFMALSGISLKTDGQGSIEVVPSWRVQCLVTPPGPLPITLRKDLTVAAIKTAMDVEIGNAELEQAVDHGSGEDDFFAATFEEGKTIGLTDVFGHDDAQVYVPSTPPNGNGKGPQVEEIDDDEEEEVVSKKKRAKPVPPSKTKTLGAKKPAAQILSAPAPKRKNTGVVKKSKFVDDAAEDEDGDNAEEEGDDSPTSSDKAFIVHSDSE